MCTWDGYDSDKRPRRFAFCFCFVFGKIQLKRESQLLEGLDRGITERTLRMAGMEVTPIIECLP